MQIDQTTFHIKRLTNNLTTLAGELQAEHAKIPQGAAERPAAITKLKSVIRQDIDALGETLAELA